MTLREQLRSLDEEGLRALLFERMGALQEAARQPPMFNPEAAMPQDYEALRRWCLYQVETLAAEISSISYHLAWRRWRKLPIGSQAPFSPQVKQVKQASPRVEAKPRGGEHHP